MAVAVGIDVSKEFHWAEIKIAESGTVLLSRRFDNTPGAIGELIEQIAAAQASHGPATVGIDVLGGSPRSVDTGCYAASSTLSMVCYS
ncbi:IS110 family transposase [Streptosporangium sp. OZ121]|uniref:IS110 family transposase n=1 Tax=Streptosporangium sp. OZ121 TaxID=3444183 RepID=UPI003F79CB51